MARPEKEEREKESSIFLSEYIAPWALTNEEMPVHLVWQPDRKFDEINIWVPPDMKIIELYNVEEFSQSNSKAVIKKLRSPNFFGFTILSTRIFEKEHEIREIKIDFIKDLKTAVSKSFIANIYRPRLSIVETPNKVTLTDDSDPKQLLNILLKISGFGNMEISTEVSFGGKFTTNVEPLFQEMARRAAAMARIQATTNPKETVEMLPISTEAESLKKKKIEVDPVFIRKTTRELIDQIKKGELTMINKQDIEDFKKWMENKDYKESLQRVMAEHLENIIIESILYYFNKYPTESVALYGGNPLVIIKEAVQLLIIRFKYRDSLLNEYTPMAIEIPIQDLRENKDKELKIPINMKWVHQQINPLNSEVKC